MSLIRFNDLTSVINPPIKVISSQNPTNGLIPCLHIGVHCPLYRKYCFSDQLCSVAPVVDVESHQY